MNRFEYYSPLDPDCPGAKRIAEDLDDPIMAMSGCADDFSRDWEASHRAKCDRCREYGAANIEVVDQ